MEDMIAIAIRISFTYLFILALLRLSGKRSIDSLSPLDFLVALILGDLFDDIFWAEVPLAQGVVALTVVLLLHTLVAVAEAHSTRIHNLVASTPTLVVDRAAVQRDGMARERSNEEELWSELRLVGQDQLEEIRTAYWETSGAVSVLPTEAADTVRKKDLEKVKALVGVGHE